jgi:hypothetical protein
MLTPIYLFGCRGPVQDSGPGPDHRALATVDGERRRSRYDRETRNLTLTRR